MTFSTRFSNAATALALLVLLPLTVQAQNLGSFGQTYPIWEPDALQELQERASQVDWKKHINPEALKKKVWEYQPQDLARLSRAQKDRIFQVDMSYTVPKDIPDGRGGILYPAGYRFNPLEYVSYPQVLVVFDGSDPDQVKWFKDSPYLLEPRAKPMVAGGNAFEVMNQIGRPVFYLPYEVRDRLQLKAVPSVVLQKGTAMEVREVYVSKSQ